MSVFRDIGLALTNLASGAASLAGGPCLYEEPSPTEREITRAIRVTKSGKSVSTVSDVAHGPRDWTTPYTIEMQAREVTPTDADEAADLLLTEVFAILAAPGVGTSLALGVMDLVIEPSVDFSDIEQGDTSTATVALALTVVHRTRGHTVAEPWN